MARSPYTQLDYSGIATVQALTDSGGINASATTFHIASAATWLNSSGYYLGNGPTNTPGSAPFVVAIDYNTINEEKVLCSSVTSGGLVTVLQRGYDGTTAIAHNSTTINCVPVFSATEAREANTAVSNTVGQVTAAGDILIGTGANAMDNLAIGAQGTNLSTNGTTASWRPGFPYTMGAQGSILTTNGTTPGWTAKGAQGSIAYAGATGIAFTAAGTSGQVLTSAGTGTPVWAAAGGTKYIAKATLTSIATSGGYNGLNNTYGTKSLQAAVWTSDSTVTTGFTSTDNGTYTGLVIPVTGTYEVTAQLGTSNVTATNGAMTINICKMGSSPTLYGGTTKIVQTLSGQNFDIQVNDIIAFTAGDVVNISASSSLSGTVATGTTLLMARLI